MRSILSILAGVSVGVLGVFLLEMINLSLYPYPSDLDINNEIEMDAYVLKLPYAAFVMVVIAHVVGSFIAAFIAGMVARVKRFRVGLIAGALLLIFAIVNVYKFGQPIIIIIAMSLTIIAGLIGARIGASRIVG